MIDPEALAQDDFDPDTYVLQATVKELAPFLDEVFELYSDARKKLVEQSSRKPVLSFSSSVLVDVEPYDVSSFDDNSDFYEQVKEYVVKVAAHLKQLSVEREGAKAAAESAITQLRSENSRLLNELSRYRSQERSSSDGALASGEFSSSTPISESSPQPGVSVIPRPSTRSLPRMLHSPSGSGSSTLLPGYSRGGTSDDGTGLFTPRADYK